MINKTTLAAAALAATSSIAASLAATTGLAAAQATTPKCMTIPEVQAMAIANARPGERPTAAISSGAICLGDLEKRFGIEPGIVVIGGVGCLTMPQIAAAGMQHHRLLLAAGDGTTPIAIIYGQPKSCPAIR
jgi:hypothetical protein